MYLEKRIKHTMILKHLFIFYIIVDCRSIRPFPNKCKRHTFFTILHPFLDIFLFSLFMVIQYNSLLFIFIYLFLDICVILNDALSYLIISYIHENLRLINNNAYHFFSLFFFILLALFLPFIYVLISKNLGGGLVRCPVLSRQ